MDLVPTTGQYYLDGIVGSIVQNSTITNWLDVLAIGTINGFNGQEVWYNRTLQNASIGPVVSRSITFSLISFMSGSIFRVANYSDKNQTTTVEVLTDANI